MTKIHYNTTGQRGLDMYQRNKWGGNKSSLAKALGMTVEQLRHITSGRRPPTLKQAARIEKLTKIPPRFWVAT